MKKNSLGFDMARFVLLSAVLTLAVFATPLKAQTNDWIPVGDTNTVSALTPDEQATANRSFFMWGLSTGTSIALFALIMRFVRQTARTSPEI